MLMDYFAVTPVLLADTACHHAVRAYSTAGAVLSATTEITITTR